MIDQTALIALGGNMTIEDVPVVEKLRQAALLVQARTAGKITFSRMYRTPAFPAGAGPDYTNAALALTLPAHLTAAGLLTILHDVEAQFGRARNVRWAGRTLDLDLLALDQAVLPDAETQSHWRGLAPDLQAKIAPDRLILPHPRLQDRAFVLVPLADVAPDWCHPLLGQTVREMLALRPRAEVNSVILLD